MPVVHRTYTSRVDYGEIWDYIASQNLVAADRLIDRLDYTLTTLATSPQMGRKAADLAPNLRSFPVGNYLIFYRPIKDGIELIRVLHGSRDITPEYFSE